MNSMTQPTTWTIVRTAWNNLLLLLFSMDSGRVIWVNVIIIYLRNLIQKLVDRLWVNSVVDHLSENAVHRWAFENPSD